MVKQLLLFVCLNGKQPAIGFHIRQFLLETNISNTRQFLFIKSNTFFFSFEKEGLAPFSHLMPPVHLPTIVNQPRNDVFICLALAVGSNIAFG
jgi:hypothetical protein